MLERKVNTSCTIFRYTLYCAWWCGPLPPILCCRRANSDAILSAYMLPIFSGIAEMSDK